MFLPRCDPDYRPLPKTSLPKSRSHVRFLDGCVVRCDNPQVLEVASRTDLPLSEPLRAPPSSHQRATMPGRVSIRSIPKRKTLPKNLQFLSKPVRLIASEAAQYPKLQA